MSEDRDGRRKPATSDPSYPYLQQPAIPVYGEPLRPGVHHAGPRLVPRQCIRSGLRLHSVLDVDQGDPRHLIPQYLPALDDNNPAKTCRRCSLPQAHVAPVAIGMLIFARCGR